MDSRLGGNDGAIGFNKCHAGQAAAPWIGNCGMLGVTVLYIVINQSDAFLQAGKRAR